MHALNHTMSGTIEAIPENLLREPIDYLSADHFRQKVACKFLDDIAFDLAGAEAPRLAAIVLAYMERELPKHIADEEEDLFPLLKQRCLATDNAGRMLSVLSEEHRQDHALCEEVLDGLRALADGEELSGGTAFMRAAAALAETQRRHLAWEDDVLLPLARERLTAADLRQMGLAMARRRGVPFPD